MHAYIGYYLLVGVLWAWFCWNYNGRVREVRRTIGDARAASIGIIVALIWPIEMVGFFVYLFLAAANYAVYLWKLVWLCVLGIESDVCVIWMRCPVCNDEQAWPGSAKAMEELGWELRIVGKNVVWHCPMCKGNGKPWPLKS